MLTQEQKIAAQEFVRATLIDELESRIMDLLAARREAGRRTVEGKALLEKAKHLSRLQEDLRAKKFEA